MKLKTIKDIEEEWCKIFKYDIGETIDPTLAFQIKLKQEAIKWIKYFEKTKNLMCYPTQERRADESKITWIKHFFNIRKKDLK